LISSTLNDSLQVFGEFIEEYDILLILSKQNGLPYSEMFSLIVTHTQKTFPIFAITRDTSMRYFANDSFMWGRQLAVYEDILLLRVSMQVQR